MSSLGGVSAGQRLGSSFRFDEGSYSSLNSWDMNFLNLPVYRADTKEEFILDSFQLLGVIVSGGFSAVPKYVASQLERD
jgi:hypothetical protein